ncbi:hypothetical protein [Algoriphagus sp. PAP.12]|uniref:hypothetical protein n=1 Tax=Algoriphagus sp. PAP.12 TaxID=2996678 RepID=UPI00227AA9BF|nr:hypothetical protein [Algoriphagus sp. PAP.12]
MKKKADLLEMMALDLFLEGEEKKEVFKKLLLKSGKQRTHHPLLSWKTRWASDSNN